MELPEQLNIVFVCYNCGSDIRNVVEDIKTGDYPRDRVAIYVVDNDSTDDSVAILQNIADINLTLIESPKNIGFGSGCNLAVSRIANSGPILFLNPDVRLQHNSLLKLVDFSRANPQSMIWGGVTCNASGQLDGKNAWREPSLLGLLSWSLCIDALLKRAGHPGVDAYSQRQISSRGLVDAVSGCFLLIDRTLFSNLGGFDERFFLYSEEIDLCRRARNLGARPMVTDQARVMHIGSKTLSSADKLNYLYHSKLLYFRKFWPGYKVKIARLTIATGALIRCCGFAFLSLLKRDFDRNRKLWWKFFKIQRQWDF
ncbi:glycosyltransferase family 2 protein [Microbulbifer sp. SAOS-129_SWC]|uniref:glycosyltransferase family 2 protein n=1 Tax=Microbulbifer sp. SAOS-129_SWC TaxID=3145235 RepID=UPI00321690CD